MLKPLLLRQEIGFKREDYAALISDSLESRLQDQCVTFLYLPSFSSSKLYCLVFETMESEKHA